MPPRIPEPLKTTKQLQQRNLLFKRKMLNELYRQRYEMYCEVEAERLGISVEKFKEREAQKDKNNAKEWVGPVVRAQEEIAFDIEADNFSLARSRKISTGAGTSWLMRSTPTLALCTLLLISTRMPLVFAKPPHKSNEELGAIKLHLDSEIAHKNYSGIIQYALELMEYVNPDYKAGYLIEIGKAYDGLGNYEEALESYAEAMRVDTGMDSIDEMSYLKLRLKSLQKQQLKNHDEIIKASLRFIELVRVDDKVSHYAKEIGLTPESVVNFKTLGDEQRKIGNHEIARKYFAVGAKFKPKEYAEILNKSGMDLIDPEKNGGVVYFVQSVYDDATGYFKEAIAADGDNIQYHLNLIDFCTQQGKFDQAQQAIDAALVRFPDNSDVTKAQKELTAAQAAAAKTQTVNPSVQSASKKPKGKKEPVATSAKTPEKPKDDLGSMQTHLQTQIALKNHAEIIIGSLRLIELDPERKIHYLMYRVVSLFALGRNLEAIEDCSELIRLMPDQAEYFFRRAEAKAKLNRHAEAIIDYSKAIEINHAAEDRPEGIEDKVRFLSGRVLSYVELRAYEEAIKDYSELLQIKLKNDNQIKPKYDNIFYERGICYFKLGNHKKAVDDFLAAIKINPHNLHFYLGLASAYQEAGKYGDSLKALEEAVKIDPGYPTFSNPEFLQRQKELRKKQVAASQADKNAPIESAVNEPSSIFQKGRNSIKKKDYDQASRNYDEAFKRIKDLADISQYLHFIKEAISDLSEIINFDIQNDFAHRAGVDYLVAFRRGLNLHARAGFQHKLGNYTEAIKDYSSALDFAAQIGLAQDPRVIPLWVCIGSSYYDMSKDNKDINGHNMAIQNIVKAAELDPEHINSLDDYGVSQAHVGNHEIAILYFLAGAKLDAEYFLKLMYRYASALITSTEYGDAILYLKAAISINASEHVEVLESIDRALKIIPPNSKNSNDQQYREQLVNIRAEFLEKASENLAAQPASKKIEGKSTDINVLLKRAEANFLANKHKEVIKDHKELAKLNPDQYVRAFYGFGDALKKNADHKNAIMYLVAGGEFNPVFYADSLNKISNELMNANKPTDALQYSTAALQLKPGDPVLLFNRGFILFSLEKYDLALEDIMEAVTGDSSYKGNLATLVNALMGKENYDHAIKYLTKIIPIDSANTNNYKNRGICYLRKKDFANAANDFLEASTRNPNEASFYHGLSEAYTGLGNIAEASKAIDKAHELEPHNAEYVEKRKQLTDAQKAANPSVQSASKKPDKAKSTHNKKSGEVSNSQEAVAPKKDIKAASNNIDKDKETAKDLGEQVKKGISNNKEALNTLENIILERKKIGDFNGVLIYAEEALKAIDAAPEEKMDFKGELTYVKENGEVSKIDTASKFKSLLKQEFIKFQKEAEEALQKASKNSLPQSVSKKPEDEVKPGREEKSKETPTATPIWSWRWTLPVVMAFGAVAAVKYVVGRLGEKPKEKPEIKQAAVAPAPAPIPVPLASVEEQPKDAKGGEPKKKVEEQKESKYSKKTRKKAKKEVKAIKETPDVIAADLVVPAKEQVSAQTKKTPDARAKQVGFVLPLAAREQKHSQKDVQKQRELEQAALSEAKKELKAWQNTYLKDMEEASNVSADIKEHLKKHSNLLNEQKRFSEQRKEINAVLKGFTNFKNDLEKRVSVLSSDVNEKIVNEKIIKYQGWIQEIVDQHEILTSELVKLQETIANGLVARRKKADAAKKVLSKNAESKPSLVDQVQELEQEQKQEVSKVSEEEEEYFLPNIPGGPGLRTDQIIWPPKQDQEQVSQVSSGPSSSQDLRTDQVAWPKAPSINYLAQSLMSALSETDAVSTSVSQAPSAPQPTQKDDAKTVPTLRGVN